ncbi:MAG: NfeD family protein [Chloroflexota bacterium]
MTEKDRISTKKAWLIVLVSLIDDIVILAVIGLAVWYFKIRLPLWAWIVIGLVLVGFIFVRTWLVVPAMRRKKITGSEGMLGMPCEVIEALTPRGVVRVEGEYWQAGSAEGDIEAGEEVEIVGIKGLKLEVKRKAS